MIVLEFDDVEIDHCQSCKGVWLDAGEIDLLLPGGVKGREAIEDLAPIFSTEKPIRCPICRRKLDKVQTKEEPKVIVDRCPRHDGVWFDEGELQDFLRLDLAASGPISQLFNEIFKHKQE